MSNSNPQILYEDNDIVVVDKPAGLVVHSDGRTSEPALTDWFIDKYPQARDVGETLGDIERPGVVHRIDRETSGVLLLAKTARGHEVLKAQFQAREVEKTYHLFVHGEVKDEHGSIRLSIGKSASDFRKWSAERGAKGEKRDALTYFKVLKRVSGEGCTFLEAKPKTGRTHQIRVHFKAIHHPLVGDKLYARAKPQLLGFERLALHARTIGFANVRGDKVVVTAPYPADFQAAIDSIGFDVLD